jgi:hypothetical protein
LIRNLSRLNRTATINDRATFDAGRLAPISGFA